LYFCLDESDCEANEDKHNDDEKIKDKLYGDKPSSKPSKLDACENEPSDDDEIVGLDSSDYSHETANVTAACVDLDDFKNNAVYEAGSFETTDRPIDGHSDVDYDKPARLSMEADSKEIDSPLNLGNFRIFNITMLGHFNKKGQMLIMIAIFIILQSCFVL